MESGIRRLFLVSCVSIFASFAFTQASFAQNNTSDIEKIDSKDVLETVISPDIKRRTIKEAKIDKENFEIGVFGGVMGVEDFGSNNVQGARFSYHISEDFFVEAVYGETETSLSVFEVLLGGNPIFNDRKLRYYNMSVGINLLPGEVYLGKNYAFNTNYYLIFGAGNTEFSNNEYITYNFGGGLRVFTTDWLALRIDFRNHLFTHTIFGPEKSIQNLEATFGLSVYF